MTDATVTAPSFTDEQLAASIADIPSEFDVALMATCTLLRVTNPLYLLKVWYSESGLRTKAHNPNGNAVGIFQAMPATLAGMGFPGAPQVLQTPRGPQPQTTKGWQGFLLLSIVDQVKWARVYYKSYTGRLTSVGTVYLATFLPAVLLEHSPDQLTDDLVICEHGGTLGWAYDANTVFDPDRTGRITLGMLGAHAEKAFAGVRATAIAARVAAHWGHPTPDVAPQVSQPPRV